ncbi:MAG: segregation/condensation protein A [Clostridia bacterium]|nr:segregation/condensation protein A [Clostridia bacterium]
MEISYKLADFEGPLDLLLHLVQKNKLNIYDIPIHELLEQYMQAIQEAQEMDMEVATEFLDMAARLVQIKSAMLLPRHEEGDEMKQQLTGELIEYQLCREAAARMEKQCIGGDLFVRLPMEIEPDYTYRRSHEATVLLDAYLAAAGRGKRKLPPSPQVFHNIVARKIVSVSSKIIFVLRRLRIGKKVSYTSLYDGARTKSELVATFLAVLELIKGKRIRVDGEGKGQQVTLLNAARRRENTDGV